jgi:hypothetical protein
VTRRNFWSDCSRLLGRLIKVLIGNARLSKRRVAGKPGVRPLALLGVQQDRSPLHRFSPALD